MPDRPAPDAFGSMRSPIVSVQPDPAFDRRLRARLERALQNPRGAIVPDPVLTERPVPELVDAGTAGLPGARPEAPAAVPYLAVTGARDALDWYAEAFGATLPEPPVVMPDGRVGHAELDIGGARVMLSEEHPEIGVVAPRPGQGASVTIHLTVDDVDAALGRAVVAGAHQERAAADHEYGRNAVVLDPFGHRWMIAGPPARPAHDELPAFRHGDIGYVSLWVPDVDRAAAFFGAVLGWRYEPDSAPQGRRVHGGTLHHGLWGEQPRSTLFLCFAVDDVTGAVGRIRAAGGTAGEPHAEPYGRVADCTDALGVRFAVFEPPGGAPPGGAAPAALVNGQAPGDLAYVTMQVVDSAVARDFYGAVLGWRFAAGRTDDGWEPVDVAPKVGLSGGHPENTTVPMYRVDDIAAAVARVRARGGRATEPAPQPYGTTSSCTDDQGTPFYLGQL